MKVIFQKIGYNFIVSVVGKVVGIILSLFIVSFSARYLGKEGFGEYSIILAFLYFFGVAADFGLYIFLIREISKKESDEKKTASNVFTLRFFLAIFILALAPFVVLFFPYSKIVKLGILIGTLGYFFLSLNQILVAIFQKKLKMWVISFSEILGRILQFFLVFVFIKEKLSVISFIFAFVVSTFISFIFSFIFAQKEIKIRPDFNFQFWRNILKKSWPFAVSIILTLIYFKIDTILLSVLKGSKDVGIYSVAYKILETVIVFPAMLTGLFLPILTASFDNFSRFKKIAEKSAQYLIIFGLGAFVGGFILSEGIIKVIAGAEFQESILVLKILFFAIAVIFMGGYFGYLIIALNLQKQMNFAYILCVFLNIAGNLLFIPKYSYIGAAYTTLFTEILVLVLAAYIVYKKINWLPRIKNFSRIILSSFGLFLFLFLFRNIKWEDGSFLKLGFIVATGTAIYFFFLILLNVFKWQDIKNFLLKKFNYE